MGSLKYSIVCVFLWIVLLANGLFAEQIRISLPSFQGTYGYGGHSPALSLRYLNDLYVDISNLSLEVSGTHSPGFSRVINLPEISYPPFTDYSWDGAICASLIRDNVELVDYPTFYLSPCFAEYSGSDSQFSTSISFRDAGGNTNIDWKEMLNSEFNNLLLTQPPNLIPGTILTAPEFNLDCVTLVFDATPIPEPSSICLLSCGMIGIFLVSRRLRNRERNEND
jgi:hypothetical protein